MSIAFAYFVTDTIRDEPSYCVCVTNPSASIDHASRPTSS